MKINWEALGTIGQWAGAIATFLAVFIAIKQGKPKVKVNANMYDGWLSNQITGEATQVFKNRLYVTAVNSGTMPVNIIKMGFKVLGEKAYALIMPEPSDLPKVLMPSDEVMIWTDDQSLIDKWNAGFAIAIAVDSAGRIYYQRIGLGKKIVYFTRRVFCKTKSNSK